MKKVAILMTVFGALLVTVGTASASIWDPRDIEQKQASPEEKSDQQASQEEAGE